MRQTTNYQLPSWDSDDRILRTDFNDLTEKTDTALADNAAAIAAETEARETGDLYVKLAEIITTEDEEQVSINMRSMDMTPYLYLDVLAESACDGELWMQLPGLSNYTELSLGGGSASVEYLAKAAPNNGGKALLCGRIYDRATEPVHCLSIDSSTGGFYIRDCYSVFGTVPTLYELIFRSSTTGGKLKAGGKFILHGMLK